jgi:hypothetical protein
MYTVINASGGTQSIVIRGAGPTTGVTIVRGESATVAWNGSDFVKVSSSGGDLTLTNLTVTGNTTLGDTSGDTLTVNATSTFASPVSFQNLVRLPSTGRSAAAALTPTNPAFLYGVASTYTDTTSSGTLAPVASFYGLAQPTLSTSNVTTYTTAATLYIANAPATAGSATITNPFALYIAAGDMYLGGNLRSNLTFSADNTYDIGASGATRPRSLFLGTNLNVAGTVGVGTLATADVSLRVSRTATGDSQYGILNSTTYGGTGTNVYGILNQANIAASASFSSYSGFLAVQPAFGAGATVTSQTGFAVDSTLTGATSNFAFSAGLAAGTGRWNFYAAGTAANYFAGQAQFANGALATPSVSNINDTNTGIYFPAADTIGFVEGGAESARFDSNGTFLVGLSTALANGKIQVAGSIGLSGNTEIRQATNTDGNTLRLLATQVVVGAQNAQSYGYTGGGLLTSISNAASAIVLDAGGVTAGHRLQVVNDGTGQSGNLNYSNAGTSRFFVNSLTGNVSIGVTSPYNATTDVLTVLKAQSANTVAVIDNQSSNPSAGAALSLSAYGGGATLSVPSATPGLNPFTISVNGTEAARFDSGRNFLLGTTASNARLNVVGTATATGWTTAFGNGTAYQGVAGFGNAALGNGTWNWQSTSTPGSGTAQFWTRFASVTSGGTAVHNVAVDGTVLVGVTNNAGGNKVLVGGLPATTVRVGSTDITEYRGYEIGSGDADSGSYASMKMELSGGQLRFTSGYSGFGGFMTFFTNGSQAMRIDTSQRIQMGTSSALYSATLTLASVGNSYNLTSSRVGAGTGTVGHVVFENDNGAVGTIQTNGSSTLYNTSSDYRLKNITGPITNSGAYIDSLEPCEGTWIADGSVFVGLVAHRAQAVSRTPVATGEKDGDVMQGMDYSSPEIIANLIAEVQSLRKRLAAANI